MARAVAGQVREVLRRLHDLPYLQTHPLARDAGGGRALQRGLIETLEALGAGGAHDGRIHRLLTLTYVEARPPGEVRRQLGLSKSVYYREHARGIAAMTSLLGDRWRPAPAAAPSSARPESAPRTLTSFVGRVVEQAVVAELLGAARLVTLTGPPGIGKTRLALEVAAAVAEAFVDGTCFVALAPVADAALVLPTVARALGLRELPGRDQLEALVTALRRRRLLLVLDNVEHVLDAAPDIAELAARCPDLAVLVTSRAVLRVSGEQVLPVEPLALPSADEAEPVDRLAESEAVQLFAQRARSASSDLAFDDDNLRAAAAICRRLDGLPLAIELAAARARVLSPRAMLARLEQGLPLPAGPERDRPDRQRTLRDAIAWSYDLLGPDNAARFRRASVFVGGCSLDAARHVLADAPLAEAEALESLAALVDQSLLQPGESVGSAVGPEPRFHVLETLREFGLERLAERGELAAVRRAHARYFVGLAERNQPVFGPELPSRLARLELERNNLRLALGWTIAQGEDELALRLGGALWQFWRVRGEWLEGRDWLGRLLALPAAADPTPLRAGLLHGAGLLAAHLGEREWASARLLLDESLAIWRAGGEERRSARVLRDLGILAMHRGDAAEARARCEESLALFRRIDERGACAAPLMSLARAARAEDDLARAEALARESLALAREAGDGVHAGQALRFLGELANARGDFAAARPLLWESLALLREVKDRPAISAVLWQLAQSARAAGEAASADALDEESLDLSRDIYGGTFLIGVAQRVARLGDLPRAEMLFARRLAELRASPAGQAEQIAACLRGLADLAAAAGQPGRAARLFAAAGAHGAFEMAAGPSGLHEHAPDLTTLSRVMPAGAFAAAWAEGAAMSLEQAVAYALSERG